MARDRILFLSDIHVGVGARTNWYQPALHEPLLLAALDWMVLQADTIAELVLLGDCFDQWTYLPSLRPPALADILAANPRLFARGEGALPRVIAALDGNVSYLTGNHDMSVNAAELAAIADASGRTLRVVSDFPYLPAAGQGRVAAAHGHQFSMLNAPDWEAMPQSGLPVGHFITRLAALWSLQHLSAGQTVADRPGSGEPTGWAWDKDELTTLVGSIIERKAGLAELTLGALADATGQPADLPIVLADGSTVTLGAARTSIFNSLYDRYQDPKAFPGSAYGDAAAFHALVSTDLFNSLTHFARELGKRHPIVVMGHTHVAEDELHRPMLLGKDTLYANSGFGCPAQPDLTRADNPVRPSFIEVRGSSVTVWVVQPGPPPTVIPWRTQTLPG